MAPSPQASVALPDSGATTAAAQGTGFARRLARPVRLVHVVRNLQMGGMEKLLVELARHTARPLFDACVVSLQARGPLADEVEACGLPVISLDLPEGRQPRALGRLSRLFGQLAPDIVHVHNHPALLYAAPAARWAGVPVVVQTRHGQGLGLPFRQRLLVRAASLLLDRVVCVSADAAVLTGQEGIPRRKIAQIWNGIDLRRIAWCGPAAGGPAVMVARLIPEKGAETLIRAAGLLRPSFPTFQVEIAGDGPDRVRCQDLANRLGLADQVRFLGTVGDVPTLLSRAGMFVLPSFSEGISLTILEAMARGLPVVTTRVGGNPEVVLDGQTGLLVPPGSPEALAEAIGQLLARPDLARSQGLAGRARVERHFDSRVMTAQYERLYVDLLRRCKPSACPPLA